MRAVRLAYDSWTEADVEGTGADPLNGWSLGTIFWTAGSVRAMQTYLVIDYTANAGGSGGRSFMGFTR